MTKKIISPLNLLFFIQVFFNASFFSQTQSEEFYLRQPKSRIPNSRYSTIGFIDSRYDTTTIGFVHIGAINKKVPVVVKVPFTKQFEDIADELTGPNSKNGELLFQLRKLKFSEKDEPGREAGYCFFRASLYAKKQNLYKKIGEIDTVIILFYSEATNSLAEETSQVITDFIAGHLARKDTSEATLSYGEIAAVDSLEKQTIKLYSSPKLTNGVYKTYSSFKNQTPEHKISEAVFKPDGSVKIKIEGKKGKKEKISIDEYYAFVHDEKPYISAEYGCYSIEKQNNDLFFIGKGKLPGSKEDKKFQIRIDHVDGSFMRVKEIQ